MNSRNKCDDLDSLFEAVLTIDNLDDCYDFFDDLCTVQELHDMGQRFRVAGMLMEGKVYSEIYKQTGASTATISRVNRALEHGCDGYRKVLERRMKESESGDNN
ncbi:MAG: YerC/YecD family TrpR-related protein [Oscillospiraceae bacterium]|jgi:TrpR-related protein YerC/YecD